MEREEELLNGRLTADEFLHQDHPIGGLELRLHAPPGDLDVGRGLFETTLDPKRTGAGFEFNIDLLERPGEILQRLAETVAFFEQGVVGFHNRGIFE